MLYFFLGFMTKFVAALFLPVVLACSDAADIARPGPVLVGEWKLWAAGARAVRRARRAVVRVPADRRRRGSLAHHARRARRRAVHGVDRSEPHPAVELLLRHDLPRAVPHWHDLADARRQSCSCSSGSCASGASKNWLLSSPGSSLPLALISIGTSKLHHYAYPFLPAAGAGRRLRSRVAARAPVATPSIVAMTRIDRRCIEPRRWSARVRAGAARAGRRRGRLLAVVTLVLGQVQLRHRRRAAVPQLARLPARCSPPSCWRRWRGAACSAARADGADRDPAVGRARPGVRGHTRAPEPRGASHALGAGLPRERARAGAARRTDGAGHLRRSASRSGCCTRTSTTSAASVRWERGDELDDRVVSDGLFDAGRQRPILMGDADYQAFRTRHAEALLSVPAVRLRDVLLLMPGPYAACGPAPSPGSSRE